VHHALRAFFQRRSFGLWLVLLTLVAVGLRFERLGGAPLGDEERWTLAQACGFSFVDTIPPGRVTATDELARWNDPLRVLRRIGSFDQPLFVLIEHVCLKGLPTSEWGLRALPALVGGFTPLVLFSWVRRLTQPVTALLAAALLAVHPLHVGLSRYARVYPIALCLLLAAYLAPTRLRGRPFSSLSAGLAGVQPLTHMLSGFGLIPHFAWLATRGVPFGQLAGIALAGGVLLATALPFGLSDSILAEHIYTGLAHRSETSLLGLTATHLATTAAYSGATLLGLDVGGLGLHTRFVLPLLAALVWLCARGARRLQPAARAVCLLGALLPLAVALGLCLAYRNVLALLPRYSLWALPFLLVLLATGLLSLGRAAGFASTAVLALLAASAALSSARAGAQPGYTLEQARAVAACSSVRHPVVVSRPIDGFVAGAAGGRQTYFVLAQGPLAGDALHLGDDRTCRPAGRVCPGPVPVCGDGRASTASAVVGP
jgi:hypothetical protein